ncbi:MAG: PilW family protein [Gammaproteobacteria bacterium]|jgi:type IV pilus assembly protein PilW|nr:PilW family protein [Gammaproteobacteria bacterium]
MNHPAPPITHRISQRGLTLVEVMVAITISLILLAGVMQIFLSSRQTYRVQDGLARIQENGRFAMQFLSNDIRMAGYTGCASKTPNVRNIANDATTASFTGGVMGYEYASLPVALTATNTLASADVEANTDVLVIKRASPTGTRLTGNMTAMNANIQIDAVTAAGMFAAGDILFISDCTSADIFAATSVSGGSVTITIAHANDVNTDVNLGRAYQTDAEVMKMESAAYYIGKDAANNNIPTLYRRRLTGGTTMVSEPLVEGVENMQILYGEDTDIPTDGSANRYLPANAPGINMANVVSVRVSLLLRSAEDNVTTKKQSYTFNGATIPEAAVPDRRLRRVFTTTIRIRNKGL